MKAMMVLVMVLVFTAIGVRCVQQWEAQIKHYNAQYERIINNR